jgi:hypothetical protein
MGDPKMKKLFLILMLLPFGGCMTAAQKATQQAQIQQLVDSMTPEQKQELKMAILKRMTGLDQPEQQPAYYQPQPIYNPSPSQQSHTWCVPDGSGGFSCNTY